MNTKSVRQITFSGGVWREKGTDKIPATPEVIRSENLSTSQRSVFMTRETRRCLASLQSCPGFTVSSRLRRTTRHFKTPLLLVLVESLQHLNTDFSLRKTFRLLYKDQLVNNVHEIIRYNSVRFWRWHITLEANYFMKFFHCLVSKNNKKSKQQTVRSGAYLKLGLEVENGFLYRSQLIIHYLYFFGGRWDRSCPCNTMA